ncbi:hypothetical protein FKP32DRAFT_1575076 [Trametes sanguinea]|nr:hypothetical protein FKP32DRAFT_1575076 [Trametes sanguinea]
MSTAPLSSTLPTLPLPPPGVNYVAVIEPSLNFLLIGTVWSSFLVPVGIALFFFSTKSMRRRPVFIMNVVAILLGLTEGAIIIYTQTRAILARPVHPNMDTTFACLTILVPLFAELILVFRVVAVYPPHVLSRAGRLAVYAPVAVFKLARIANDVVFVTRWARLNRHSVNPLQTGQTAWDLPNAKIEWFLQFFDTTYTSALFLSRLQRSTKHKQRAGLSSAETAVARCTFFLPSRLRTLFWIAVSNYILPVVLNFAQLIFVFRDPSFLHGSYIFIVNNYVQIIGVLLATIWATGTQLTERARRGAHAQTLVSEIEFASLGNGSGRPTVPDSPAARQAEGTLVRLEVDLEEGDVKEASSEEKRLGAPRPPSEPAQCC